MRFAVWTCLMLAAGSVAALNPSTEIVVPAGARGDGAGGSVWQMDLFVLNPGSSPATAMVHWLERDQDNSAASPFTVDLPPGRQAVLVDVIGDRVGLASGGGAFRIVSDQPIVATSRIYNLQGGSTFGQGFEGLSGDQMARAADGTTAWIAGLQQSPSSRSNLFAVAGPSGADFSLVARGSGGAELGSASFSVPPWGAFFTSLQPIVGSNAGDVAAELTVTSGGAWFAGSRIDESTGDPFTLAAAVIQGPTFDAGAYAGSYSGSWQNTTFGSSGAASMEISVDSNAQTVAMMIDMDGSVFGSSDPPAETFTGTYDANGFTVTGSSATFGEVEVTIGADGAISGAGTDIPNPGIAGAEFSGTATPEEFSMNYLIQFSGGGGTAEGVITMLRQ